MSARRHSLFHRTNLGYLKDQSKIISMEHIRGLAEKNKKKFTKKPRYTMVLHDVREKLGLSVNTYVVIDAVHKLSHSDLNHFWCTVSKDKLADFLGLGRRTVFRSIDEAFENNLMEKNDRGDLRTTQKWVDTVELYTSEWNKKY